jgi:DNA repair exonuclease SbcCD ATPase subunit
MNIKKYCAVGMISLACSFTLKAVNFSDELAKMETELYSSFERITGSYGNPTSTYIFSNDPVKAEQLSKDLELLEKFSIDEIIIQKQKELKELEAKLATTKSDYDKLNKDHSELLAEHKEVKEAHGKLKAETDPMKEFVAQMSKLVAQVEKAQEVARLTPSYKAEAPKVEVTTKAEPQNRELVALAPMSELQHPKAIEHKSRIITQEEVTSQINSLKKDTVKKQIASINNSYTEGKRYTFR